MKFSWKNKVIYAFGFLVLGGVLGTFLLDTTFAANVVNPSSAEPASVVQNPQTIAVSGLNTPTANPPQSTVGPTFSNTNMRGYIYNQQASDLTAEASPLQLFDYINAWGRINSISGIWNTNGDVFINDNTVLAGTLDVRGAAIINGGVTINGGTEPLTLSNATGEANITFSGGGVGSWQVGTGWSGATGGASTLFFFNNNTTRQKMALEQNGTLTVGDAAGTGGLQVWGNANVDGDLTIGRLGKEVPSTFGLFGDMGVIGNIEATGSGIFNYLYSATTLFSVGNITVGTVDHPSNATINGNITLTGTINDSNSAVTINDSLSVSGNISDPDSAVTIADSASITGALSISGAISDPDSAVTINDGLTIAGKLSLLTGSEGLYIKNPGTGESEIAFYNSAETNGWTIGTDWSGSGMGGADDLYFFNSTPGSPIVGNTRMMLDTNGNLTISGNIRTSGSEGGTIGRFYQSADATSSVFTDANKSEATASCTAGDYVTGCSGHLYDPENNSLIKFSGAWQSGSSCVARGIGTGATGANTQATIYAHAWCFSPDG